MFRRPSPPSAAEAIRRRRFHRPAVATVSQSVGARLRSAVTDDERYEIYTDLSALLGDADLEATG